MPDWKERGVRLTKGLKCKGGASMPELNKAEIEAYLKSVIGSDTRVLNLKVLGKSEEADIKAYGYGTPVQIDYEYDGKQRRAVLHTISPGPFGHEHMSDRAQMLLWDHKSFNLLPRHVRSIDAGAFRHNGTAVSLGDAEEFFVLTEYAEGRGYVEDVTRMRNDGQLQEVDVARADALCDYLVEIHRVQGDNPELYVRRIRELVGHSECIMGLIDSYPPKQDIVNRGSLKDIENTVSIGDGALRIVFIGYVRFMETFIHGISSFVKARTLYCSTDHAENGENPQMMSPASR
jgi:hypothetical protein